METNGNTTNSRFPINQPSRWAIRGEKGHTKKNSLQNKAEDSLHLMLKLAAFERSDLPPFAAFWSRRKGIGRNQFSKRTSSRRGQDWQRPLRKDTYRRSSDAARGVKVGKGSEHKQREGGRVSVLGGGRPVARKASRLTAKTERGRKPGTPFMDPK